ncbi:MAG: hypothetical protein JNM79_17250, partial [Burkholderiales bacterium]|nr:hypothetical protein [Burkholderiales bacterium]
RSTSYNAIGNITAKSDAGNYTYPGVTTDPANPTRPHAVSSVAAINANGTGVGSSGTGGLTVSHTYDANGNLTAASGTLQNRLNTAAVAFSRSLSYTAFNLPASVMKEAPLTTYVPTRTGKGNFAKVELQTSARLGRTTQCLQSLHTSRLVRNADEICEN